jgi:hypothetical protein
LTKLEKQQGFVIVLVFVLWFPLYLVWVRPVINQWASQYVESYPAVLHAVPAIGLPLLVALVYEKFVMWRRRDSNRKGGGSIS